MSAVTAEELRQLRRRKPFQPFRVHLKNGETYDVLNDLEILVGNVALSLTVHDPKDSDNDYPVCLEVGQVIRIESLDLSLANGRSL